MLKGRLLPIGVAREFKSLVRSEMRYCKKCLMPDTRPGIIFDEEGVCMGCRHAEQRRRVNWNTRRKEFVKLLAKYKRKDGGHDCIVPWSSGKDSSTVAHRLKFEFGMNPLLVKVAPQIETEEGRENRERFLNQGFDFVQVTLNPKVHKKLSRKFFLKRGDPWFVWSQAVAAVPYRIAVNFNIPLIVYAEHGESMYGGKVRSEKDRKERDITFAKEVWGMSDPKKWAGNGITLNDVEIYRYPPLKEIKKAGIKAIYFGYYFKWVAYRNYLYAKKHWNFQSQKQGHTIVDWPGTTKKGRTEGTFTNFDSIDDKLDGIYYYLQYIKFGFGRAVRDASRAIQAGIINRKEGLKLAKKYDGEFPKRYFKDFLEWTGVTEKEFWKVVDSFRSPDIWGKKDGKWKLKYPLK
jgi:N-acetyl sugar amidotransferase